MPVILPGGPGRSRRRTVAGIAFRVSHQGEQEQGAGEMPRVQAFATVHCSADSMWREIGSFQGVGRWHPMLRGVQGDGEQPGAMRTAETQGAQRQVERLQHVDPEHYLYRYQMTSNVLPIADYVGVFRVRDDGPDKSTVIWSAHFNVTSGDEKAVIEAVQHFLSAGARSIGKRLRCQTRTPSALDVAFFYAVHHRPHRPCGAELP